MFSLRGRASVSDRRYHRDVAVVADRTTLAKLATTGGLALFAVALLALTAWQYAMPSALPSTWGVNSSAVADFRQALAIPIHAVGIASFRWTFRLLLVATWAGYVLMLVGIAAGARLGRAAVWASAVTAALVLTVLWPASLSIDTYGYVAYGRQVVHGLNPYVATPGALAGVSDPNAHFTILRSPYGPLWTWMCAACVALSPGAATWAPVVLLKLLAAGATIAIAWTGRALAAHLQPDHGELTLAALALNPLLLIEGAGNGHNDLVMLLPVLWALLAVARGRALHAGLAVGVAAAIKFLPLLLLPWIAARAWRSPTLAPRRRAAAVVAVFAAGLLPSVVAFAPLWHGAATLRGIRDRWALGQSLAGSDGGGLAPNIILLAIYVCASGWVLARPDVLRMTSGWLVVAGAVLALATGIWFPWYFAWILAVSLCRWDRKHVVVSCTVAAIAILFTFRYLVVPGG